MEHLPSKEKCLFLNAAMLTYGFKKIKNNLNVSKGKAIFGSLLFYKMFSHGTEKLDYNEIIDILADDRRSICVLNNYFDVQGYEIPFSNEIDFLTNLSMYDSCKIINRSRPEIKHEHIIVFVINHKEQIKKL
ncbi:hypothetical protein [Liberiplasma polymorphum]|uniref:hypothetical protein n=1 Tax=Liberiplasma polymorphum TaxID=3374570 RepID=UPI003775422D